MNQTILLLLGCAGLAYILMYGTILDRPRNILLNYSFFRELLDCPFCIGFWVGVFWGYIQYKLEYLGIKDLILIPFSSSFFCGFTINLLKLIIRRN